MIFKLWKLRRELDNPDPLLYELSPYGFHCEQDDKFFDFFSLAAQDAYLLHSLYEPFSSILYDVFMDLFAPMDVVMELNCYEHFMPRKWNGKRPENTLQQFHRWRNEPDHFLIKQSMEVPKGCQIYLTRTTKLEVLSAGVDRLLLDEYFYQQRNALQSLASLELRITGAEHTPVDTNQSTELCVQRLKRRQCLHLYLSDVHPALTIQVRKGTDMGHLRDICKRSVEQHGGVFRVHLK